MLCFNRIVSRAPFAAAGKTNLLEALSLLGPGRGLRRARLDEIRRHRTTEGWTVAATVDRSDRVHQVGTGLSDRIGANRGLESAFVVGLSNHGPAFQHLVQSP